MSTTTATPWRTVTRLHPSAEAGAAATLAAAFADDPVFTWMEPDPVARRAALPELFAAFLAAQARHRSTDVAVIGGATAGAALWVPPGVEPVHPDDAPVLEERMAVLAPDALARAALCTQAFATVHPDEPAWYLNFLGAEPAHRGRGVGSALLRAVLDRCDRQGEPAYLEATSPRNRALYERHGFRLLREVPLPDGPTTYAMWRNPVMPPSPPWPRLT